MIYREDILYSVCKVKELFNKISNPFATDFFSSLVRYTKKLTGFLIQIHNIPHGKDHLVGSGSIRLA